MEQLRDFFLPPRLLLGKKKNYCTPKIWDPGITAPLLIRGRTPIPPQQRGCCGPAGELSRDGAGKGPRSPESRFPHPDRGWKRTQIIQISLSPPGTGQENDPDHPNPAFPNWGWKMTPITQIPLSPPDGAGKGPRSPKSPFPHPDQGGKRTQITQIFLSPGSAAPGPAWGPFPPSCRRIPAGSG